MPTEAREEARLPGAGAVGDCEILCAGLTNKLRSSGRAMCPLTTVPFLQIHNNFIFRILT